MNVLVSKNVKSSLATDLGFVPVKFFHQTISHLVDAAAVWARTMRQDNKGTHFDCD